jgi:uncharacterized membrane protein
LLQFPTLIPWDSLHPLIIHFPIALLLVSPLFILVGAFLTPSKGRPYMVAALILLLLGTGSLFLAVETGEAASELAERTASMSPMLESHQALATETKGIFAALSAIFLGIFFLPRLTGQPEKRLFSMVLPLAFLVFYGVGILFLVNTADAGGRLVHEFGVHAMLPPTTEQTPASPGNVTHE